MTSESIVKITRLGIRFANRRFYDPALYARRHLAKVSIGQNERFISVKDLNGKFICIAYLYEDDNGTNNSLN